MIDGNTKKTKFNFCQFDSESVTCCSSSCANLWRHTILRFACLFRDLIRSNILLSVSEVLKGLHGPSDDFQAGAKETGVSNAYLNHGERVNKGGVRLSVHPSDSLTIRYRQSQASSLLDWELMTLLCVYWRGFMEIWKARVGMLGIASLRTTHRTPGRNDDFRLLTPMV